MEETKEINKETVTCRNCGTVLRDDAIYCHECGQSKNGPWLCPNCKNELQDNQNFCPSCGVPVGPSAYKKISIRNINKKVTEGVKTITNSIANKTGQNGNENSNEKDGTNLNGGETLSTLYSGNGKSKIVAILLAIFLGTFSAEYFYLGYKQKGYLKLCLLIPWIVVLIPYLNFIAWFLIVPATLGSEIWSIVNAVQIGIENLKPADGLPYKDGADKVVKATVNTIDSAKR